MPIISSGGRGRATRKEWARRRGIVLLPRRVVFADSVTVDRVHRVVPAQSSAGRGRRYVGANGACARCVRKQRTCAQCIASAADAAAPKAHAPAAAAARGAKRCSAASARRGTPHPRRAECEENAQRSAARAALDSFRAEAQTHPVAMVEEPACVM